jgi:hypothetical protein
MNKMKKLLFFSVAIGLLLNINAQTRVQTNVQTIENRTLALPTTTHQRFVEQTRNVFLAPKEFSALRDKPVHKANYQYFGQITNIDYGIPNLGEPNFLRVADNNKIVSGEFIDLFPDSLLASYSYDIASTPPKARKDSPFASAGFMFDPYSLDFDKFNLVGLFRTAEGVGYGYRLDTLLTVVDYRMDGTGYDPNHPDTLRFYISYHNRYNGNVSGLLVSNLITSDQVVVGNVASPYIRYAEPFQPEGPYATTPYSSNNSTIIKNYVLSPQDSVPLGPDSVSRRIIELPIKTITEDGFPVPAGALLSVIIKFIPGYTYQNNDTLAVRYWNTDIPVADGQFVDGSIQHNYFAVAMWNYDTAKMNYVFDQTGYNSSLLETQYLRYKDTVSTIWDVLAYHGGYPWKPVFYMSLSVNEDNDDTVHIAASSTPPSVTQIANLISNIYPNPATTQLTIDLANAGEANAIIYNMLGQEVLQKTLSNMNNRINIATLPPGMYVVKVKQNEKIHTVKMSKK